MGGFSIWHWLILGAFVLAPLAVLAFVIWVVRRARRPQP